MNFFLIELQVEDTHAARAYMQVVGTLGIQMARTRRSSQAVDDEDSHEHRTHHAQSGVVQEVSVHSFIHVV